MAPFRILRRIEHDGLAYGPGDEAALEASGADLKSLEDLSVIRRESWYGPATTDADVPANTKDVPLVVPPWPPPMPPSEPAPPKRKPGRPKKRST